MINSYDYNAHNAYELWCTAPADPGVSAYNNVWKFYINASGSPLYTGNNNNEPAGKAFPTYVYTSQYYFTEIDMWFAAAPVGTLQWRGGAISVGEV